MRRAGDVICLLCEDADGVLLGSTEAFWRFVCPDCGAYEFDGEFGELVSRARTGKADYGLSCRASLARRSHEAVLHGHTLRIVGHGFPPHATVI